MSAARPGGEGDAAAGVRVCVLDALRAVAAAVGDRGGDYVDPGAVYLCAPIYAQLLPGAGGSTRPRYAGASPCLVGAALGMLGVAGQVLAAADLMLGCTRISHLSLSGVELTDGARLVLAATQDAQDGAASWGRALAEAVSAATEAGLLSEQDIAGLTPHLAAAGAVQEAS